MGIASERVGVPPADRGPLNVSGNGGCPDVVEIRDPGDLNLEGNPGMRDGAVYLVIGTAATPDHIAMLELPEDVSIAAYEAGVFIPEEVLLGAAENLLASRTESS
jgi:hypothetical protein